MGLLRGVTDTTGFSRVEFQLLARPLRLESWDTTGFSLVESQFLAKNCVNVDCKLGRIEDEALAKS